MDDFIGTAMHDEIRKNTNAREVKLYIAFADHNYNTRISSMGMFSSNSHTFRCYDEQNQIPVV